MMGEIGMIINSSYFVGPVFMAGLFWARDKLLPYDALWRIFYYSP